MISKYLNALRVEKSMTYQQLADKANISLSTVERVLSGKGKDPSFNVLRSLGKALGANMDAIERAVDSLDSTESTESAPRGSDSDVTPPTVPEKSAKLATAADLNATADMFVAMLREKDEYYERLMQSIHKRHADDVSNLRAQYEREISGMSTAHAREARSKDRWITLLAIVSMMALLATMTMMLAAIKSPNVELFGNML